jgi:hypothetical protein
MHSPGILTRDFTRRRHAPATAPHVIILCLEGGLPIRPNCDSMTHGNGLPLALGRWGVAFDLKWRCRHTALTSHGISSAARRARANAGPWRARSRLLRIRTSVRANPSFGAVRRAAAPAQDALTWWRPRPLTPIWPEKATTLSGPEMATTSPGNESLMSGKIQNVEWEIFV